MFFAARVSSEGRTAGRLPLRQRRGGELHEDAQTRGGRWPGLSRHRRGAARDRSLHRRGLQSAAPARRAGPLFARRARSQTAADGGCCAAAPHRRSPQRSVCDSCVSPKGCSSPTRTPRNDDKSRQMPTKAYAVENVDFCRIWSAFVVIARAAGVRHGLEARRRRECPRMWTFADVCGRLRTCREEGPRRAAGGISRFGRDHAPSACACLRCY
jgi:hypothetical protein